MCHSLICKPQIKSNEYTTEVCATQTLHRSRFLCRRRWDLGILAACVVQAFLSIHDWLCLGFIVSKWWILKHLSDIFLITEQSMPHCFVFLCPELREHLECFKTDKTAQTKKKKKKDETSNHQKIHLQFDNLIVKLLCFLSRMPP